MHFDRDLPGKLDEILHHPRLPFDLIMLLLGQSWLRARELFALGDVMSLLRLYSGLNLGNLPPADYRLLKEFIRAARLAVEHQITTGEVTEDALLEARRLQEKCALLDCLLP